MILEATRRLLFEQKGWTPASHKSAYKTLTKGKGKGQMRKGIAKMKGKVKDPAAYVQSLKTKGGVKKQD